MRSTATASGLAYHSCMSEPDFPCAAKGCLFSCICILRPEQPWSSQNEQNTGHPTKSNSLASQEQPQSQSLNGISSLTQSEQDSAHNAVHSLAGMQDNTSGQTLLWAGYHGAPGLTYALLSTAASPRPAGSPGSCGQWWLDTEVTASAACRDQRQRRLHPPKPVPEMG